MIKIPCELCLKKGIMKEAVHSHHLYSNTVYARKMYGEKINDKLNIMHLCFDCHIVPKDKLPKMNEQEFCNKLGIICRSKIIRKG
jgi:hypothetical protein